MSNCGSLLERLRDVLHPDFTVERPLGGGGMGCVFLGRDVKLDRFVAIKVLRPEMASAELDRTVPPRSPHSRPAGQSPRDAHPPGQREGWAVVLRHGLPGRHRHAGRSPEAGAAAARRMGSAGARPPGGPGRLAPTRHRPPRRQAGQHLPGQWPRRPGRLRHRLGQRSG